MPHRIGPDAPDPAAAPPSGVAAAPGARQVSSGQGLDRPLLSAPPVARGAAGEGCTAELEGVIGGVAAASAQPRVLTPYTAGSTSLSRATASGDSTGMMVAAGVAEGGGTAREEGGQHSVSLQARSGPGGPGSVQLGLSVEAGGQAGLHRAAVCVDGLVAGWMEVSRWGRSRGCENAGGPPAHAAPTVPRGQPGNTANANPCYFPRLPSPAWPRPSPSSLSFCSPLISVHVRKHHAHRPVNSSSPSVPPALFFPTHALRPCTPPRYLVMPSIPSAPLAIPSLSPLLVQPANTMRGGTAAHGGGGGPWLGCSSAVGRW